LWVSNPNGIAHSGTLRPQKEGPGVGFKPQTQWGVQVSNLLLVWPSANELDLWVSTACQVGFMSLCFKNEKKRLFFDNFYYLKMEFYFFGKVLFFKFRMCLFSKNIHHFCKIEI